MEDFYKVLKKRKKINLFVFFIMLITAIITICLELFTKDSTEDVHFYLGLVTGILTAWLIISIVYLVKIQQCLKNENKLRDLYIKETDERNKYIESKSAQTTIYLCTYLCLFAFLIAYPFNKTVAITLYCTLLIMAVIKIIVKNIYEKKI